MNEKILKREDLPTPCYIIDREVLEKGICSLKNSLEENWKNWIVGYSFKTNGLPWIAARMKNVGFYAEVVSEDEYDLAGKLGFTNVIYNGPVKGKRSFFHGLETGAIINLDAKRELEWLEEAVNDKLPIHVNAKIGLRVNFDLESVCPGETSGGSEGSRFGFSLETGEFKQALERLQVIGIKLSGLHFHFGSKTRSVNIYRGIAKKACEIKQIYNLEPEYVDLGGGYFGGMPDRPGFPEYIKAIKEELSKCFDTEKTALIVEPGTSLVSPPVSYMTSVVDCKDTYANRLVVTDGSRCDIDPLHRKSTYFLRKIYGNHPVEDRKTVKKQVICGFTCMEDDRILTIENEKELKPGDKIIYEKSGGYTMCLTPLFIRYFPAVYVTDQNGFACVREAWTVEEYISKSVW